MADAVSPAIGALLRLRFGLRPTLTVSDGSRGSPPASFDNTRTFKGFWDWSR
jgi:hypothetical protein